jgi:outer membrane protein W
MKSICQQWLAALLLLVAGHGLAQQTSKQVTTGVEMHKGTWFAGGTLSTGNRQAENENQLFTLMIKQKKNDFEVRIDGGYMIKENLAVGMGLLYGQNNEQSLQQNSDGVQTDVKVAGDYYAFRPFVKNFIPLGQSHRFYVIIPTELQIGFGSKVKESTTDAILTRTFTTSNFYGIALRPGMLVFLHKNFGFEVNVGAFGLNTSLEKSSTTNQPDSRVRTRDLDLKINILNLSLGFSGYF